MILVNDNDSFLSSKVFDDLLNGDLSHHPSYFANATGYNYYFNYLLTESPKEFDYFMDFVNLPKVRYTSNGVFNLVTHY